MLVLIDAASNEGTAGCALAIAAESVNARGANLMQDHLFVIPSYAWLRSEAERLVERLLGPGAIDR